MKRIIFFVLFIILLGTAAHAVYQRQAIRSPSPLSAPREDTSNGTLTQEDLRRGWYWGAADQKKSGTPDSWTYQEAGKSSCWHRPGVVCRP